MCWIEITGEFDEWLCFPIFFSNLLFSLMEFVAAES